MSLGAIMTGSCPASSRRAFISRPSSDDGTSAALSFDALGCLTTLPGRYAT